MSRKLEFSIGESYHLYSRGIEKRITFLDHADHMRFLILLYTCNNSTPIHISNRTQGETLPNLLDEHRGNTIVSIGAYCLMPNHFHILIKEEIPNGISMFMQKVLTGYTMYFNKRYKRTGGLFCSPFRAVHVNNDRYLKYLFSYIHLNPIKLLEPEWKDIGIQNLNRSKDFLKTYSYSSYSDYLGISRKQKKILSTNGFPDYFHTIREFEDFIQDWLTFPRQGFALTQIIE